MRELLGILVFLFAVSAHYKSVSKSTISAYYFPALIIKLLAGVGVGIIYKYYYAGGDTWNYYSQSIAFGEVGFSSFSNFIKLFEQSNYELIAEFSYTNQPRAALMVKIVSIINLLSGHNYWVTSFFFSLFSFIGVYQFANWLTTKYSYSKVAALSLFVWPSFVFWSSGILKETLAVGLILYIIPTFFKALDHKSIKKAFVVLFCLYLLFLIKYYFAAVLIIVLFLYTISVLLKIQSKTTLHQVLIWVISLGIGFIVGGQLHYNLRFDHIIGVIIDNNKAFASMSSSQSQIAFTTATEPWVWLIINAPKAVFASLFMPLIPSANLLFTLASIENWILFGLLLRALYCFKRSEIEKHSVLLLASFTYIITLAVFLALSTPNLGTLSRYKVSFMPFVLVLILLANKFSYWEESE